MVDMTLVSIARWRDGDHNHESSQAQQCRHVLQEDCHDRLGLFVCQIWLVRNRSISTYDNGVYIIERPGLSNVYFLPKVHDKLINSKLMFYLVCFNTIVILHRDDYQ